MSCICRYVQWGKTDPSDEMSWVPASPKSDDPNKQNRYYPIECEIHEDEKTPVKPPLYLKLLGPDGDNDIWYLQFVSSLGSFYQVSDVINGITPHDGDVFNAWYAKGGDGDHVLALTPFVWNEEDGTEGFLKTTKPFVDFNVPPTVPGGSVVDTDKMQTQEVTATVHASLPEFENYRMGGASTSNSIIIKTSTTEVVFEKIFVYMGNGQLNENIVTVEKNTSCFALAIFRKSTNETGIEIGTIQYPKISKTEWPQILSEIMQETIKSGGIVEYLNQRQIRVMKPEVLKNAVTSIDKKVANLQELKSVIKAVIETRR